jgi:hypothetical protein
MNKFKRLDYVLSRITILHLLIFIFLGGHILQARASPPDYPMIFRGEHNGGNCNGCEWISARGSIVKGTADIFEKFMLRRASEYRLPKGEFGCPAVALDSPGGSLIEGIRLGELLRKYKCTTTISRSKSAGIAESPSLRELVPGECYSACAYAFLGGIRRWVGTEDRYGVHQHFRSDALLAPLEKTLNAIDMSTSQLLTGLLVNYVVEMGVDPRLVSVASLTAPGVAIKPLDKVQLEELNIVTDRPIIGADWILYPVGSGLVTKTTQIQDDTKSVINYRFFCSMQKPYERYFDIIVNINNFEEQLKFEARNDKKSIISLAGSGKSVKVPIYNISFSGGVGGSQMIIRVPASNAALNFMKESEKITWEVESSRASSYFFQGWFSVKNASSLNPFSFANCI